MNDLTLIVCYYRNMQMLQRQVEEWNKYPPGIKVICVDDGSPEPARPIIEDSLFCRRMSHVQLYRIGIDRPWNREGARNLGAHVATTDWIIQVDIDHVMSGQTAELLLRPNFFTPNPNKWYRFPRWRVGAADETRLKDAIPKDADYGQIHPHVDSYLVRRDVYWKVGGYNEDFAGAIGGGNEFLHRLELAQPVDILPPPIRLEVYTRAVIKDASDWSLSRDKTEYTKRRKIIEAKGNPKPKNPLRFEWKREL